MRSEWRDRAGTLGVLLVVLQGAPVFADGSMRPIQPMEQRYYDRLAEGFARILPKLPAGWEEVRRDTFSPQGLVPKTDKPEALQGTYEWRIARVDRVEPEMQAVKQQLDARGGAESVNVRAEALGAEMEKLMSEYAPRLEAAINRGDMAAAERLQKEMERRLSALQKEKGLKNMEPARRDGIKALADTTAAIRIYVNPLMAGEFAAQRRIKSPAGVAHAFRSSADPAGEREGVTTLLIGSWAQASGESYKLQWVSGRSHAAVHGVQIEIEAAPARAESLMQMLMGESLRAWMRP